MSLLQAMNLKKAGNNSVEARQACHKFLHEIAEKSSRCSNFFGSSLAPQAQKLAAVCNAPLAEASFLQMVLDTVWPANNSAGEDGILYKMFRQHANGIATLQWAGDVLSQRNGEIKLGQYVATFTKELENLPPVIIDKEPLDKVRKAFHDLTTVTRETLKKKSCMNNRHTPPLADRLHLREEPCQ